jgi:hypothetical protein
MSHYRNTIRGAMSKIVEFLPEYSVSQVHNRTVADFSTSHRLCMLYARRSEFDWLSEQCRPRKRS